MQIAGRTISPTHRPLVIAEIGINHGGDLSVAKEMVKRAASAGCEMIKHQTHIVEDEMTDEAKAFITEHEKKEKEKAKVAKKK